MKWWMVGIGVFWLLAAALGVLVGMTLWHVNDPRPGQELSGHVTVHVHIVPGDMICYPPSQWLRQGQYPSGICEPATTFETLHIDPTEPPTPCATVVSPAHPKPGEKQYTCNLCTFMCTTKEQHEDIPDHNP
jgi:hypothetical protein